MVMRQYDTYSLYLELCTGFIYVRPERVMRMAEPSFRHVPEQLCIWDGHERVSETVILSIVHIERSWRPRLGPLHDR